MPHSKSKCIYCTLTNYGLGCPFSPVKVHVHAGDITRCIYCGSYSVGLGCPYNPMKRKIHVHGLEFNTMSNESIEKTITAGYLMNKLTEDIKKTSAYKLGLVDETGVRLKQPETEEEKNAYTLLDSYVYKLRRALGPKLDLLNTSMYIQAMDSSENSEESLQLYEKELHIKPQIEAAIQNLYSIIDESKKQGLSTDSIEKIILNTFLDRACK